MIRLLILGLLFLTTLSSQEITTDINQTVSTNPLPKVLYESFEKKPQRVINGEIFHVTLKTLSTVANFKDITYELSNYRGLKILNTVPYREKKSRYFYDTFYFMTTSNKARLPDFKATLHDATNTLYKKTTLVGEELNVISLNPKNNFSNIIANSLEITEYKTTSYDNKHNIVVFVAIATNSDISKFKLQNVYKQGVESMIKSHFDSKIIYYAVIDKKIENFSFSYFNLKSNGYELINIPIVVIDDSVTTQTDLEPKDQSHQKIKIIIVISFSLIALIFIIWRKKYIYLIFMLIPLIYVAYLAMPSKQVCIKAGSQIHLLPMYNGTIFERTNTIYRLQKEGSVNGFVKVKLRNEKIGWVRNEDICKD